MSRNFKIKIKKDYTLNIEEIKIENIILKIKGKNNKGEIFNANIIISFSNKSNKIKIKKINISKLEIEYSSDDNSFDEYRNIYTEHFQNILSYSSSLSSYNNNDKNMKEIYNQLVIFIKNIKLSIENYKVNSIHFTLKNTNIKKIKLRGKVN